MQIILYGSKEQQQEWLSVSLPVHTEQQWYAGDGPLPEGDAYFDLLYEENGPVFQAITGKPVFVHAVTLTGAELPANCIRINAWKGFLGRRLMEIAGNEDAVARGKEILEAMQWPCQVTPDQPGLIAARVIAMIVNEAYYGWGEGLSSKEEIDTAMKLGTNYPYGPFEWSERIGLANIYRLLEKLCAADERYAIAPALQQAIDKPTP